MINIYTDGSCLGNPGPGGWAVYYRLHTGEEIYLSGAADGHTTNNRMELTAVVEALKHYCTSEHNFDSDVNLISDSQYVMLGGHRHMDAWAKNGWKTTSRKSVRHIDLWKQIKRYKTLLSLDWTHVRGHAGNYYNEIVDQLAREEATAAARRSAENETL